MNDKDKEAIDSTIKVVLQHEKVIDAIAKTIIDVSTLINTMLPKCRKCQDKPATMRHKKHFDGVWCDRCAATLIVQSQERLNTQGLTDDRQSLTNLALADNADVALWEDVPNAEAIRRIMTYAEATKTLVENH